MNEVSERRRLTAEQLTHYRDEGYVTGLPVFNADEVATLQARFPEIRTLLRPGKDISRVNWWHKKNRFLYDNVCTDSRILDYVECLLGPNFFLWGSQFFVKDPGDGSEVPWHQDAQYWPLEPMKAVTVFVAFDDCDAANACMRVIPRTHRESAKQHRHAGKDHYVLQEEILPEEIDTSQSVDLELRGGEISLHDDRLVHGSGPNLSERPRIGFTMRYSSTDVKCDLAVWPTFAAFLVRGVDKFDHNPRGVVPTGFEAPDCMRPA